MAEFNPDAAKYLEARGPLAPLFSPMQIGSQRLRNRFVMPGMQRMSASNGEPCKDFENWYSSRAKGGAALVISEGAAIDHPTATKSVRILRIAPSVESGWKACAEAVHQAGARFLVQLFHEGAVRVEGRGPHPDAPTLSPSGLIARNLPSGRAATRSELESIKAAYVNAARLAEKCGADGVEIHSAHGYLLHQFIWPATNRRIDDYGGSMANRISYARELVEAIRQCVSRDFLVSFRFSQFAEADFDAKPIGTPEELAVLLTTLRRAGVDLFNVSTRRFWLPEWPDRDSTLSLAGWTKRLTDAAVMTVGSVGFSRDLYDSIQNDDKITDANGFALVRKHFEAGRFDLLAVGRGMFADPDWVAKVAAGTTDALLPWSKDLIAHILRGE